MDSKRGTNGQSQARMSGRSRHVVRVIGICVLLGLSIVLLGAVGRVTYRLFHPWHGDVGLTRVRLMMLEKSCHEYKRLYGSYPHERVWCREMLSRAAGDKVLLEVDLEDLFQRYFDGWGHAFHYRCPGIHHRDSVDLYSIGRNGVDENGGGDDVNNWSGR